MRPEFNNRLDEETWEREQAELERQRRKRAKRPIGDLLMDHYRKADTPATTLGELIVAHLRGGKR